MKIRANVIQNRAQKVLKAVFLLGSYEQDMSCKDINEMEKFMRAMHMYNQTWRKSYTHKEKKEPEPVIKKPVYNWYSGIFLGMGEV